MLTINRTVAFKNQANKYENMFEPINTATVLLQTKGKTLADCRDVLDALTDAVESGRRSPQSPLYQCNLKEKWISINARISPDPKFESGVCKIQRGETSRLTDAEKLACSKLLLHEEPAEIPVANNQMSLSDMIQERKKRRIEKAPRYRNCDFILGSAAEVERLWSISKHILCDNRKTLTPILFEALLFLKVNKSYWNLELVAKAMSCARSVKVQGKLNEDAEAADA